MDHVISFILGGGRGAGLYPLTRHRSVPAVSVAGKYRIIDIPVSNCINSGLQKIYVLTQFLSVSLHRHIAQTYSFAPFSRGWVQVLPAQQTNEAADWYKGTADALRKNLRTLRGDEYRDVLILSGDGLYRMDLADLVRRHRESGADATLAAAPVPASRASHYGLLRAEGGKVAELVEKPKDAAVLESLKLGAAQKATHGIGEGDHLANMGIYAFRREWLVKALETRPEVDDLVTQLLAPAAAAGKVGVHVFAGWWHDLGSSIAAYHEVNLALASASPPFDFNSPEGVIYTRMRHLPATRLEGCDLIDSLVSDGCVVLPGASLRRSVVGQRSRIGEEAQLREAVLCGADRFETPEARQANRASGVPDIGVGKGSVLSRCVVDKDCRIGAGVRIVNEKGLRHHDGGWYAIRDGIVVVPKGTTIPDGTVV
ncbi:MAG: glucose-1-phosphate adenylyltransferase [Gemmataceae bacterium]|nr:glucose-1-phosphate adenylyltransferase [Gemmataceae bacterium]